MTATEATQQAAPERAENPSPSVDDDRAQPTPASGEDVDEVEDDELEQVSLTADPSAPTDQEPERAADAPDPALERLDRKKLEEQLEALKKKELELRRALLMADHPALAEAIRTIEGRAFAIARVEARHAQGPSKAEARRREALAKKLSSLRERRAELDEQIGQLEAELDGLGVDRAQVYEAERREALEQLFVALGTHDPAFRELGLEPQSAIPEIVRFLPEIEALAEQFAAAREP